MKKEQRKPSNLKEFLGIKEPPDRGGKKKPTLKKTHFTIWYFVIAFLIILLIQNYFVMKKTEDVISYSEFKEALRANKIQRYHHHSGNDFWREGDRERSPEISNRPGGGF